MSEFVKPKTEYVADKDYVEKLVNVHLKKDLHGDEEICQVCHGTGLVIRENPYGLRDDPDKSRMFPYSHQTLDFAHIVLMVLSTVVIFAAVSFNVDIQDIIANNKGS